MGHILSWDWRGWIARKLLSIANRLDPDCKIMCDAQERWIFRRGWQQPSSEYDQKRAA